MELSELIDDADARASAFPVVRHEDFFGHAGVCPLPAVAADALRRYAVESERTLQESAWAEQQVKRARRLSAQLIGAEASEISLLGPTSLGLNLVAAGLDWQAGDEVVFYRDDYPANVYCWMDLQRLGVKPVALDTDAHLGSELGAITWDRLEPLMTNRTRLVSVATCNFISGCRIDVEGIGRELHARGIMFCVDAIQTLGAFAMNVEHVDFLAADSHKWMLGPDGAGIFYVSGEHRDRLRPALLGSWNVRSPRFIAQEAIAFEAGGRRFEPGMLNHPGIAAMAASLELLLDLGIEAIGARLLELHDCILGRASALGFERYLPEMPGGSRSGIVTLRHRSADVPGMYQRLREANIIVSLRHDRAGEPLLRFSPHAYNTPDQLNRAFDVLAEAMG